MRAQAKERERFLIDLHLSRVYAIEEGRTKGREEGREEGRGEGEEKKARETAYAMKKKGYSIAEIAELTGLPLSEIERLK
jgi:predicted transposase/invertase (TIGR01784 family)